MSVPSGSASLRAAAGDPAAELRNAVAFIGGLEPPLDLDRCRASLGLAPRPATAITFRFCFLEVPFLARAERRASAFVLAVEGDLGVLPFTIENAARRRRLRRVLSWAQQRSGLRFEITPQHLIRVQGEIELGTVLTPTAMIAGTTTLLLRAQPCLEVVVAVAGEP
jgi:hypothetical protein